jgi:hypothetical protein
VFHREDAPRDFRLRSPDGHRFLMLKPAESQTSAPTRINVVLNWLEELMKKVPVK